MLPRLTSPSQLLTPYRYRTQLCNDGTKCRRHICFFAHSLEELRVPTCKPFVPPDALAAATTAAAADIARKVRHGTRREDQEHIDRLFWGCWPQLQLTHCRKQYYVANQVFVHKLGLVSVTNGIVIQQDKKYILISCLSFRLEVTAWTPPPCASWQRQ